MTGLYQHETESLIGQFGLNLITSESDFLCLHHMKALFHHAATSWALPHGTIQNCLLRYRPCLEEAWNPACFCEFVHACTCLCVCVSCLGQWMAALSASEQLCMLFVLSGGKCTSSPSSGEQRGFAITAPPVCLCVHLSQSKAGDQMKFLTLEDLCQPRNTAASLKAAVYCFSAKHLNK